MMAVMDKMMDYFRTLDLAMVKGLLEKRNIGDGVILEGFKTGKVKSGGNLSNSDFHSDNSVISFLRLVNRNIISNFSFLKSNIIIITCLISCTHIKMFQVLNHSS